MFRPRLGVEAWLVMGVILLEMGVILLLMGVLDDVVGGPGLYRCSPELVEYGGEFQPAVNKYKHK